MLDTRHHLSRPGLVSRERAGAHEEGPVRMPDPASSRGSGKAQGDLPHLARIQWAFGPGIDLSRVRAEIGSGPAAETPGRDAGPGLRAQAQAQGDSVRFRRSPSLRVAAHEAAHVAQQRAGLSRLNGARERAAYEGHANAVADRVVQGRSAADLLPGAGGKPAARGPSAAPAPVQAYTEVSGQSYDLLADDGKMAVKDHSRSAWAVPDLIKDANDILAKQHSKAKAEKLTGQDVKVTPPDGGAETTLSKFRMRDRDTGSELETIDDCGGATQQILGSEYHKNETFVAAQKFGAFDEFGAASTYRVDDLKPGGNTSTTEDLSAEIYIRIFEREFGKTYTRLKALQEWWKLGSGEKTRLSKQYGINDYAVPKMGQSVTISSERDMGSSDGTGYNFHFGYNLMASGNDYVTLEDYDSSGVPYYFDMYGPASKKQSWNQAKSNVDAVDYEWTSMVVTHAESIKGEINADNSKFEVYVGGKSVDKTLPKGTKVILMLKGSYLMKVKVLSGSESGQIGWIYASNFAAN